MPFSDREEKILDILRRQGSAGADEMARELYISRPTLRRDLIKLEQKGAVNRTHGGAKLTTRPADDTIPASLRMDEDSGAKNMIAAEAAKLVRDGDTVMLDGSTSALHLAAALREKHDVVVITSGARTALILGGMGINTICTGGQLIGSSESFIGGDALRTISCYNADVVFFSCRGLDAEGNLTDNSIGEDLVRLEMMKRSRKSVLLLDSGKIGRRCLHNLRHVSEIDHVVCDKPLPEDIRALVGIAKQA